VRRQEGRWSPRRTETAGRRGKELSNLADAYRKAAPYLSASTTLVASVASSPGSGVGRPEGREPDAVVPLARCAVGMTGGFVGFFRTVLGKRRK